YKGLGEMNADQLFNTTMNKKTRRLLQVHIDDPLVVENRISVLLEVGMDYQQVKNEQNIQFNEEDAFLKEVRK
ncbi:MAG TPA: DNA topoisomerase IV subunit B, partial [Firmicutes bacterium]|nr:DNA topoisomerase IV subunit B [Bacillota bacterium]